MLCNSGAEQPADKCSGSPQAPPAERLRTAPVADVNDPELMHACEAQISRTGLANYNNWGVDENFLK